MVGVAGQFFKAVIGNLAAEIIAGHVFNFVGFVENYGGIFRKDAAEVVLFQGQVGEKQMVIDDDEVGFLGALVHGGDETFVEVRRTSGRCRCRGGRRAASTGRNRRTEK